MNKDSKIFVAGHRGLVGSAILKNLQQKGYTNFVLRTHAELDLTDQCAVNEFFATEKPEYVFLAAAHVGGIMANSRYRADFIYINLMIQNNVIHLVNVGDSRAYYVTETEIIRVTKDHSLVETMVDHGDITADEARHHPSRNLITRALGRDTNAACDSFIRPMESGSYILLCTDGLVNTVTDQEMLFEIIHGDNQETCLKRLLEIAKNQGAPDNVTAVLMQKL